MSRKRKSVVSGPSLIPAILGAACALGLLLFLGPASTEGEVENVGAKMVLPSGSGDSAAAADDGIRPS